MNLYLKRASFAIWMVCLVSASPVFAEETNKQESLKAFVAELQRVMQQHNDVVAAQHDKQALRSNLTVVKKSRFPGLSITSSGGREQLVNNEAADTITNPRDLNLKLTLPLFNRATTDTIKQLRLAVDQGGIAERLTVVQVLLQGITAQLNVTKAIKVVRFADESVENIRKQTELETAKVSKGAGLNSDVLQAKTQLAGAEARRMQALNELRVANNRYAAVFGSLPGPSIRQLELPFPSSAMPITQGRALSIAVSNSPTIRLQRVAYDIARQGVQAAKSASFLPTINFSIDNKYKNDNAGAQGFERDTIGKIELSYNFNTAGSAFDTVGVAKEARGAASKRYSQAIILIQEQVQNTWATYELATRNAEFRGNQAEIAGEFLRLAREEQALGQRTLLEVLAGETAYINAASDAEVARSLVVLSAYNLLATIGLLDLAVFASE